MSRYLPPDWVGLASPSPKISIKVFKKGELVDTIELTNKPTYIIGRNSQLSDYVCHHGSISRQHIAIVQNTKGQVYVIDLNSSHGTKVQQKTITSNEALLLHHLDQITLGESTRVFEIQLPTSKEPVSTSTIPQQEDDREDIELVDSENTNEAKEDVVFRYKLPMTHELVLSGHTKAVSAIAVDAAGARVATGSFDYMVRLWDFGGMARTVRAFREIEVEEGNAIVGLSYSPTGDKLLVATGSSQPKVLDREGIELIQFVKGDMYKVDMSLTHGHTHTVTGAQWHPYEKDEMISCSLDGTVREWNLNGKTRFDHLQNKRVWKSKSRKGLRTGITACAYAPNVSLIWAATSDGQLQAFDPRKRSKSSRPDKIMPTAHDTSGEVGISSISMAPNNHYMASRAGEGCIKLWDLRNMVKPIKVFPNIPTVFDTSNCCFNANSTALVASTGLEKRKSQIVTGGLRIFDVTSANMNPIYATTFEEGESAICVHWSSKLNQILVGFADGKTKVLYSPEHSQKGALLTSTRKLRPHEAIDHFVRIESYGDVHLPNALLEDEGDRKRKYVQTRKDPIKSKIPERPVCSSGEGGLGNVNFTQYYMQGRTKATLREEDPREAILKYAKKASAEPQFLGSAYAHNQPLDKLDKRYQLADQSLEDEKQEN